MHEKDLETLIQSITDLVLAKLKSEAHLTERQRTLTVIWPVASATKDLVLAGVSAFRHEHMRIQWVVKDELLEELLPLIPTEERARCHGLSRAPLQTLLSSLHSTDVVLLAATHFASTRQLIDMDDERPWVHLLLQAHLAGQHIVVCKDLLMKRGLGGKSKVAQEAEALQRELEQMGFALVQAMDLAAYLKKLAKSANFGSPSEAGLVTEQDVENLVRAGHKELRLHFNTLVTPLAQSKAAELGLSLVRKQA